MSSYRTSPLAAEATGKAEVIPAWNGHTMGGRVPAFMALAQKTGGVYAEGFDSVAAGLKETGLDFEVRMETVQGVITREGIDDKGEEASWTETLALPNHRVTVAYPHDGREPFAICPTSAKYQPLQVEEALGFGDGIIGEGGKLVALGAYGKPVGARVYAAFQLPEGLTIGGKDPHDLYLTVTTSFDRSTSTTVQALPMRLACTNEAPIRWGNARFGGAKYSMNHTKGSLLRVQDARAALDLAVSTRDAYKAACEELLKVKANENKALVYWRQVFGVDTDASKWSPRQVVSAQPREDQLVEILGGPTCAFGKGTAYAAVQAVTEYVDFFTPVRGGDQLLRARRNVAGTNEALKERAYALAAKI